MRAHQILSVYDLRFGKGESDEISHAARAFSLLLAGGALARVMKLTSGGLGAFSLKTLQELAPDGLQMKKPGALRRAS